LGVKYNSKRQICLKLFYGCLIMAMVVVSPLLMSFLFPFLLTYFVSCGVLFLAGIAHILVVALLFPALFSGIHILLLFERLICIISYSDHDIDLDDPIIFGEITLKTKSRARRLIINFLMLFMYSLIFSVWTICFIYCFIGDNQLFFLNNDTLVINYMYLKQGLLLSIAITLFVSVNSLLDGIFRGILPVYVESNRRLKMMILLLLYSLIPFILILVGISYAYTKSSIIFFIMAIFTIGMICDCMSPYKESDFSLFDTILTTTLWIILHIIISYPIGYIIIHSESVWINIFSGFAILYSAFGFITSLSYIIGKLHDSWFSRK